MSKLFAVKTEKLCRCCGKLFSFATSKHKVITSNEERKVDLPPGEIVEITKEDLSDLEIIDIGDFLGETVIKCVNCGYELERKMFPSTDAGLFCPSCNQQMKE